MFRTALLAAILVTTSLKAATASAVVEVRSIKKPDFRDYSALEKYRSDLYVHYRKCATNAELRGLSRDELDACALAYLKIKLSFLDGVTLDRYETMKPTLRATANSKGYAAYRAWLHRKTAGLLSD